MTDDEQTILKAYLMRVGTIASEDDFEEFCRQDAKKGKGSCLAIVLAESKAYALGCADVHQIKEIEARTYNTIIENMARVLIAERTRAVSSCVKSWLYLPIGPEGPRPWPHMAD